MEIKIKDIIGEYCSQRQNGDNTKGGETIRELIINNWKNTDHIAVSFEGVKTATPSFIDEAFGKLVLVYSLGELRKKISFSKIDDQTKERINKSIELRLKSKEEKL